MNDPLEIVHPRLRQWVTPEMVAAASLTPSLYGSEFISFSLDNDVGLKIDWTPHAPRVGRKQVTVDPTKPWPPAPEFEFGERVTYNATRAVITDPTGNQYGHIGINIENSGLRYRHPDELTPGWPE